jgi:hypothetical protein
MIFFFFHPKDIDINNKYVFLLERRKNKNEQHQNKFLSLFFLLFKVHIQLQHHVDIDDHFSYVFLL